MDVSSGNAFDNLEATDRHVFTDSEDFLLEFVFNGGFLACELGCEKSCNVCGLGFYDSNKNTVYEFLERSVLCNEVGFGVNFNDSGAAVSGVNVNDTVCSNSVCLLSGNSKALLTKDLYSFIKIAVSGNESLFALHHTAAGLFTKLHNNFCGNICHSD